MISFKKVFTLILSLNVIVKITGLPSTTAIPSKQCQLGALDLVFVVDESGSIGKTNYYSSMNKISTMVRKSLTIGQSISDSHVGMVLFDSSPNLYFGLNTYTSKNAVCNAIIDAPYSGLGTNIYLGLREAISNVFGQSGDRLSVPNVLLLITDGQDGEVDNLKKMNQLAAQHNITIFAIGIGSAYNYNELLAATGDPSRVFNSTNFDSLQTVLHNFCLTVEHNVPTPIPSTNSVDSSCSKNINNLWVDMVFVIDSSKGVDRHGLLGVEGSILGFVNTGFKLGKTSARYSRAGIVNMGETADIIANLDKYSDKTQFMNDIFKMPYKGDDKANIYNGLKKANEILMSSTGNPNRKQVVYLFSSNTEFDCNQNVRAVTDENPCRLAASMKEKGITIVTFALKYDGNKNVHLMKGIGSDCFNFFNDNSMIENMISSSLYANCFCPAPLIQFKNDSVCLKTAECIYVHESPTTWTTAQMICPLDGLNSTLANIFSQEKNEFLVQQLNSYQSYPYMFGLNDMKKHGKFQWDSNSNLGSYTNWDVNEPNLKNGNCAKINVAGKWFMASCNDFEDASNYICEEPACDADNFCP